MSPCIGAAGGPLPAPAVSTDNMSWPTPFLGCLSLGTEHTFLSECLNP